MRTALVFIVGMIAFPLVAQEKPRVFVAPNATRRSQGYKIPSYSQRTTSVEDRTVEISRDLSQSCKEVTVSAERKDADYVLRLSWTPGRSEIAVYRKSGDLVGAAAKSTVGGAVKAACEIVKKDQTSPTASN